MTTTTTLYVAGLEIETVGTTETKRTVYYPTGGAFRVIGGENPGLYFRHGDHLGSTSVLSSSTGTKVAGSDVVYAPFGEIRSGEQSTLTDFGYTGQRRDDGTGGLMYYGARYYLPGIQHFISADTIVPDPMNTQAFNRYAYVVNNPLKYSDPSGHAPRPPIFPRPTPKMPAPRIPSPSVSPGGGSGSDSSTANPQDPSHSPDGGGENNNSRDRGTSNTTIPNVADGMYDLIDGDDNVCRMDPCLKNPTLSKGLGYAATALDILALIVSGIDAATTWGMAIDGAGLAGLAGTIAGAIIGEGAGAVPGALGGSAIGFTAGYLAGWAATSVTGNAGKNALGWASFGLTAAADVYGDRTGWDPELNAFVVGGDTQEAFASAVVGTLNSEPTTETIGNFAQAAYDLSDDLGLGMQVPEAVITFASYRSRHEEPWGFLPTGIYWQQSPNP